MVTNYENTTLDCQDTQNPHPKENSLVDYEVQTKYNKMMNIIKNEKCDYQYMIGARKIVDSINSQRVDEEDRVSSQSLNCGDLYMIDTTPTLSREIYAITEDEVKLEFGIFEYCHNCENNQKLMDYPKSIVFYRNSCKECLFEPQSLSVGVTINDLQARFKHWVNSGEHLGRSFLGRHLNITGRYDAQINLIEDVGLLFFHFIRSRNNTDRCVALVNFCKLRGMAITFVGTLLEISDSLFKSHTDNLSEDDILRNMGFEPQGDEDTVEKGFAQLRGALNTYDKLKEFPIYKKLHKFFMYLLCNGLLQGTNINFRSLQFDKFEEESLKRTHKPGFDMVHAMLDTVVFVCEAGYDYFKTGSFDKFVHSGSSYDKWIATAQRLKMQSKFLSNPVPHGINRFKFVAELKDAIEKGKAIVRFTGGLDKGEKLFLQKTLMELQLLEAEETTRRSAQQPRKDPFGILIHGSSHIAKSKLTEIMFKHYGKCFDLPIDDSYRYTRCPTDEYWSGFDSTQWCIVMDDIAFLAPTGEVDPTLKELLQVKNSVPYTPPQAALEDKGRTPVKAELLIATTNTKHLNLHAYFACPFAIARRLSFVVTPTVKPEYTKNGFMVDSKKIPPTAEGQYMDIWNFEVSVPMPESQLAKDNQRTRYEKIESFEDIHSFLQWYIFVAEEHAAAQAKADQAAKTMAEVEVCKGCKRVVVECLCNTEWEHRYAKCGVCERTIGNCCCTEQVCVEDFNTVYKAKLWVYSKIIEGERFDFEEYEEEVLQWKWYGLMSYILCSYYAFYATLMTVLFFLTSYLLIRHAPQILHYYYQLRFGYLWKYRMLFAVCGNELDTWRLIFRIGGDKASKVKIKKNYLYGLGVLLALPATLMSLRSLWRMYLSATEVNTDQKELSASTKKINHSTGPIVTTAELSNMEVHEELCVDAPTGKYTIMRMQNKGGHVPESSLLTMEDLANLSTHEELCIDTPAGKYNVMRMQGNEGGIPKPLVVEKPTFYYHDPYAVTDCVISGASKCSQEDILEKMIMNNTATFHLRFPTLGRGMHTVGVNVHGNLWLLNKHSVKAECGVLDIICDDTSKNVSKNVRDVAFSSADFIEIPDSDAVVIQLRCMPPGKSLLQYFPIDSILKGRFKGKYIMRSRCGTVSQLQVDNIHPGSCPVFGVPGYFGTAIRPTQLGDCGSLCLVEVGGGKVIFGSHTSGAPNGGVCMQHISQKMLNEAINRFEPQVHEGVLPISAPGYERELMTDLHPKSCIRFLDTGTAKVYGSFKGYRAKHKSHVEPNYICDYVVEHGYKADFGPPKMDWQPWHLAIKDMTTPVHCYLNENIRKCEDAFYNDIVSKLGDKLTILEVYSLDVALNGAPGVTYVDKLNSRTSAGNPFKKSKEHFIKEDQYGRIVEVDKIILDRVAEIEACYDMNTRYHPQFCGHLKDEPVSLKKIASGKTRVFTGGEFAWSIVVRKYLLSHIRLIQNNPFIFEAMPGVVAQSTEWRDLYEYLTVFGKDRMIAGDYGKFDKRMAAPFILSAFNILERLAKAAGWPDEDLRYIRCIAQDTAFPCIDFNGDLIEIQGNPSGHPLTVIINCLVNSLYMRYAYLLISGKPLESFQDNVKLATYGDDNIMGVSLDCPNFNHTRIAAAMKCIGVEYTMAEKEAESVPFIHIDETTFLKRAFRFDNDIGCIVAPLDESSFHKMLTARLPKENMAAEAHAIRVIETAQREYFFHGKHVFEEKQKFFLRLVEDCGLKSWVCDSTFPNYYDLVYDFWMKYDDVENAMKFSLREHTPQSLVVDAIPLVCEETTLNRFEVLSAEETYKLIGQKIPGGGLQVKSTCCTLVPEQVSVPTPVRSVSLSSSVDSEEFNRYKNLGYSLWSAQSAESALGTDEDSSISEEKAQTVSFLEKPNRYITGFASNLPSGATSDATQGADLGNFLSRPVLISSYVWNESDALGTTVSINPWQLFFNTASIKNKMINYAWLKCDLKIKVMVNASPFYYGTTLVSYQPLPNFHPNSITNDSGLRYFIPYSQRPHIWIYPQNNEGGEMTLPFLYHKNWLSTLVNQDFIDMGKLTYFPVVALQSANGVSAGGVTISTYAWAENVVLSGPTAGFVMQSDEYTMKPVSSIASALSRAAGELSGLPVIGNFMTATQIGANTVASVASSLGFSNPPVIENTMPVKSQGIPQLASPEISYPIEKLTIDPKNELTVDPSAVGLPPDDELSLQHIVGRESYLTTFSWSSSDSADALLFSSAVTPEQFDMDSTPSAPLYLTPMAWVSSMFNHWRGDVIFRFRFICTQFHRGRVRIIYDPSGSAAANILNVAATQSVVFNEVVDLTKDTNVEVRVPYQQALAWCTTFNPTDPAQIPFTVGSGTTFKHVPSVTNGMLAVRVVTSLTSPVLASTIQCIVSVRGAENLEFANPSDVSSRYSYFVAQSDEYEETESHSVVAGHAIPPLFKERYLINFGEQITSIRQLLRRLQWYRSIPRTNSANTSLSFKKISMYKIPPFYGYNNNGWDVAKGLIATTTNFNFNYCGNTYLHWILPAFIGQRGSINYSIVQDTSAAAMQLVARQPTYSLVKATETDIATISTTSGVICQAMRETALSGASSSGIMCSSNYTLGSVTWQFPNYSSYKFNVTTPANFTASIQQDDTDTQSQAILIGAPRAGVGGTQHIFVGAGTDFMPVFFLNVPTVFVYSGSPVPV
nr:MAG: hypothetical protein [Marnaviridae sp.]